MQLLAYINDKKLAQLFCDHLYTLGIKAYCQDETLNNIKPSNNIEPSNDPEGSMISSKTLIFCQSEHLEKAKSEFAQFVQNPHHEKYQQSAWQRANTEQINSQLTNGSSLTRQFSQQFLAHAGRVTLSVFLVCWLVYLLSVLGWADTIYNSISFYFTLTIVDIIHAPHRLITPAIFHFSLLHIVFNSFWWWQLAGDIEKKIGKSPLIVLALVSAITANIGQFYASGNNFAGLSGVIYALLGYIWWLQWLKPHIGLALPKPLIGFMLFWLVLGFTQILPINIGNTSHLIGLLTGCCFALLPVRRV